MNIAIFDTCPQPMWLFNEAEVNNFKKMSVFREKCNVIEYGLNYNRSRASRQKKFKLLVMVNPVDVISRGISLAEMLEDDGIVVVNIDCKDSMRALGDTHARIITCGLNAKSSVTASAIESGGGISTGRMLLCVQRSLPTLSGGMLDPQEVPVTLHGGTLCREMVMAAAGLILSN